MQVKGSVGMIREKSKKSESDSFAPAGKTRIDSDSITGPTSPKNTKKTRAETKAAQQSKNYRAKSFSRRKNLSLSKASRAAPSKISQVQSF
jgi:hypothetical protein